MLELPWVVAFGSFKFRGVHIFESLDILGVIAEGFDPGGSQARRPDVRLRLHSRVPGLPGKPESFCRFCNSSADASDDGSDHAYHLDEPFSMIGAWHFLRTKS
jgi:hypothetical protein